jgi:hypothetical protein
MKMDRETRSDRPFGFTRSLVSDVLDVPLALVCLNITFKEWAESMEHVSI